MTDGFPSAAGAPRLTPRASLGGLVLSLLLGLVASAASGCGGNVSCVLANGCRGNGGLGDGESSARLPEEGQWIVDGSPLIERTFPDADTVAGTSPIVVLFNESMNPDSLSGALSLIPIINGFEGQPLPLTVAALLGDGRALVLFPPTTLGAGQYVVVLSAGAEMLDITGQLSALNPGVQLADFSVGIEDPEDMRVIATYPADASTGQSETGEIVVIFDRAAQENSVTSDSIQVTIDGDEPAFDPEPEVLEFEQFGFPIPEPRVFTWRQVDTMGDEVALPIGGQVLLEVSPAGFEITDLVGTAVLPFVSSFTLNDLARPLAASLLSQPQDAIGTANLTLGNDEELLIQIDLLDAEEGDFLDLFLFGTNLDVEPRTIALGRELELQGTNPIMAAFYGLNEVDLLLSTSPLEALFVDGAISFAFRLRRGALLTPLRVLDVNSARDGIQDPILDTTGPIVEELFFGGGTLTNVRSDLRDIVISGRANEFVRAVEVASTTFGDNGVLAGVIGLDEEGLFVSSPISVGLLPAGEHDLTVVAYDEALNASIPFTLSFKQVGRVGPTVFTPGDNVSVEVYDAITLQPIAGALVITHGDEGNGVDYPFSDVQVTAADGSVTVTTAGGASVEAIVTIEAVGYDIFSFHGITSAALSLPLTPSGNEASATVEGDVVATELGLIFVINTLIRSMGDSRRPDDALPFYGVDTCVVDPFGDEVAICHFGPEAVRPGLLGVQTLLLGFLLQDEGPLSISGLIQTFDIRFPMEVLAPGDASMSAAEIPYLLATGASAEDQVRELLSPMGMPVVLAASGVGGIDIGSLVGDANTTGDPFVTVKAVAPGYPGSFPVGIGLAFDQGSGVWNIRSGYAGTASAAGTLGSRGLIDTDLFLQVELRDADGNRVGGRPRISTLDTLPLPRVILPVGAPQLASPMAGGNTGAQAYTLEFPETLVDFYLQNGLYRAELEDAGGRRWVIWRPDAPGGLPGTVRIHVPDLVLAGGIGLGDGTIRTSLGVFGVPGIDPVAFLWSDIPRTHDLFAEAAPVAFDKP
ncbi:MAG: hypothetical protein ACI8QS_000766 [Planctomycetota bacterium]